jgi:aspartyl aminopeptidase
MPKKANIIKDLEKQLLVQRENICKAMSAETLTTADDFCEGYKAFLDAGKTERGACRAIIEKAEKAGFRKFEPGRKYKAGSRIYAENRAKAVTLAVIGSQSLESGVNIIASHIDSPRLDLKANPLFADADMAFFKTHYYGGIKKYQWTSVPLP